AERLAAKPWLTAENLDAPEFSRRRKREEKREREAYQGHRQSAAEHCGHAVTLDSHRPPLARASRRRGAVEVACHKMSGPFLDHRRARRCTDRHRRRTARA